MFHKHWRLALILGLFVALGTTYSVVTPLFEASDEFLHYPVVVHLQRTGRLPVQQPGVATAWDQEGSQPPLYYALGAALTAWIDTGDLEQVRARNPHGKFGLAADPDNKNLVIHTDAERFPWRGTVLAVHVLRFCGVALGAGSVTLTYALARTVWPERSWLPVLAAALVAFNPMFIFLSASVNNDNLIVFLGSWALLLNARVLRDGLPTRRAATLAVVLGLAALTKLSGLTLLPVTGAALAVHAHRTGGWRRTLATGLGMAAGMLLIAGWWYARNLRLYGELTGLHTMVAIAGPREDVSVRALVRELPGFFAAYWAFFGAASILADPLAYRFFGAISLAAVAGLAVWLYRQVRAGEREGLLLPGFLALQVAVTLVALLRWTLLTYGSQGRLLFPVIGAISGLMALGLLTWLPNRLHPVATALVGAPLLLVAAISPFRYIAPAYEPPPAVAALPAEAEPIGARYGTVEVVAVRAGAVDTSTGRLPATLYLRAVEPADDEMSLYLRAAGPDGETIGRLFSYPGGGNLPVTQMETGVIYEDTYSLHLSEPRADVTLEITVGEPAGEQFVAAVGRLPDGTPVTTITARASDPAVSGAGDAPPSPAGAQ